MSAIIFGSIKYIPILTYQIFSKTCLKCFLHVVYKVYWNVPRQVFFIMNHSSQITLLCLMQSISRIQEWWAPLIANSNNAKQFFYQFQLIPGTAGTGVSLTAYIINRNSGQELLFKKSMQQPIQKKQNPRIIPRSTAHNISDPSTETNLI